MPKIELTDTQAAILRGAIERPEDEDPLALVRTEENAGGLEQSLASLQRRGLMTKGNAITAKGRHAYAEHREAGRI